MEDLIKTIEESPSSIFSKDDVLALLKKIKAKDDYSVEVQFEPHFLPLVENLGFRHVFQGDAYVAHTNEKGARRLIQLMDCTIKGFNVLVEGKFLDWQVQDFLSDDDRMYTTYDSYAAWSECMTYRKNINLQSSVSSKLEECFTKLYQDGIGDVRFSGSVTKEIRANSDGDEINISVSVDQESCDLDDLDLSKFQEMLDEELGSLFE